MVNFQLLRVMGYKSATIALCGLITCFSCLGQNSYLGNTISFGDVLRVGLENNYNIRLSKSSAEQIRGSLQNAHGHLNPYLDLTNIDNNGTDPTITYGTYRQANASFVVPTSYGVYFSAGFGAERLAMLIPKQIVNISGYWGGITLPILRGLGKYNTTNASIFALKDYYQSKKYSLSDDVVKYVRDVAAAYVQYQTALSIYNVRQKDVEESGRYERFIQELIQHNQIAAVELDRAQSFIYGYKEKLIDAKNNLYNAYYLLNKIEGNEKRDLAGVNDNLPICTDSITDPNLISIKSMNNDILTQADSLIEKSTYMKSLEYNQMGAEMEMKGAKNALMNQLDLGVRYYHYGAELNQPESEFSNTFNSPYPGQSVYITLAYHLPIKNEINRGEYLNRTANYEYQKEMMEKTKYEANNGIISLISNLNNLIQLYKSNRELAGYQQKTYENEFKKYKLGAASQLDIISAYQDFAETRAQSYQLAYNIYSNVVQLKYLIGTLPTEKTELERSDLLDIISISR